MCASGFEKIKTKSSPIVSFPTFVVVVVVLSHIIINLIIIIIIFSLLGDCSSW